MYTAVCVDTAQTMSQNHLVKDYLQNKAPSLAYVQHTHSIRAQITFLPHYCRLKIWQIEEKRRRMILAVAKVLGDKNSPKDTEYTGQKLSHLSMIKCIILKRKSKCGKQLNERG